MTAPRVMSSDAPGVAGGAEYAVLLVADESAEYRYAAFCPALPGCMSDGRTRAEALAMIEDAIAFYLSSFDADEEPELQPEAMIAMAGEYAAAGFAIEKVVINMPLFNRGNLPEFADGYC